MGQEKFPKHIQGELLGGNNTPSVVTRPLVFTRNTSLVSAATSTPEASDRPVAQSCHRDGRDGTGGPTKLGYFDKLLSCKVRQMAGC